MKRLFATFVSCLILLSATVTTPALAEVKDEAQQSDVSVFQAALTTASDGIQSVLDGVKTNVAELFSQDDLLALVDSEIAIAPETAASQDAQQGAAIIPSNDDGVIWSLDHTTCTLKSGANVDAYSLAMEITYYRDTLTTFIAEPNASLTGIAEGLFGDCISLTTVNLAESFKINQNTTMSQMFKNCSSLTSLTLPASFDTSSVESMSYMFFGCSALTSLTLPATFDTSSVRSMNSMFQGCTQLERINLSMCSSEVLQSCSDMFANCDNLIELNLGNIALSAVYSSSSRGMFAELDSATGLVTGSIPNIERITMSGACILEPGEGEGITASGTFFDYKEPLSWSAYYQDNTVGNEAIEGVPSAQGAQKNLSAVPTAVLTGFDEFKAYQETHPGLTTYIFDEQPTPPGPTPPGPTPDPTPDPTPEPTPDVVPASHTDVLPVTGDTSRPRSFTLLTVLLTGLALLASGYSLIRKRLQ